MRSATKKKVGKDKAYLAWIHALPCHVCVQVAVKAAMLGMGMNRVDVCVTRTEAAHVGERGLSQKCPDREAIPLCAAHHREGKESVHTLGKKFWQHHGIDKDQLIEKLNERYDQDHAPIARDVQW